jgi:hypothetical protein
MVVSEEKRNGMKRFKNKKKRKEKETRRSEQRGKKS